MKLYEFDNPLRAGLVAVVGKLAAEIEENPKKADMTVDQFIRHLQNGGVDQLDRSDLIDLIKNKKPPLSTYIRNIKDDKIVWKNVKDTSDTTNTPEKKEKIVKSMADKALKSK